jgi:hypothetical protein
VNTTSLPAWCARRQKSRSLLIISCASSNPPSAWYMVRRHQHAGAGHRNDVALGGREAKIAQVIGRREPKCMACGGIQKLRTDHSDLRPLHMLQHRVEPVRLHHLDVVVQEKQVFAGGHRGAAIVEVRSVECIRNRNDLVEILLQPDLPGDLIVGNIVDADELEIVIGGALAQRLDARLDIAPRRSGRNEDRDHTAHRLRASKASGTWHRANQHICRNAAPRRGPHERRYGSPSRTVRVRQPRHPAAGQPRRFRRSRRRGPGSARRSDHSSSTSMPEIIIP